MNTCAVITYTHGECGDCGFRSGLLVRRADLRCYRRVLTYTHGEDNYGIIVLFNNFMSASCIVVEKHSNL